MSSIVKENSSSLPLWLDHRMIFFFPSKEFLNFDDTYKGGLELEEQPFTIINAHTTSHNFAGTIITVKQPACSSFTISCQPLNKNSSTVTTLKKQIIPRYIPNASIVPTHYKNGMQITSLLRLMDQSSDINILIRAMVDNFKEMSCIGYNYEIFSRSLFSLSQKNIIWAPIAIKFFNILFDSHLTTHNISNKFEKILSLY